MLNRLIISVVEAFIFPIVRHRSLAVDLFVAQSILNRMPVAGDDMVEAGSMSVHSVIAHPSLGVLTARAEGSTLSFALCCYQHSLQILLSHQCTIQSWWCMLCGAWHHLASSFIHQRVSLVQHSRRRPEFCSANHIPQCIDDTTTATSPGRIP